MATDHYENFDWSGFALGLSECQYIRNDLIGWGFCSAIVILVAWEAESWISFFHRHDS